MYHYSPYICIFIDEIITELFGEKYGNIMYEINTSKRLKCLPELWDYNPGRFAWFQTLQERKTAIENCIKLTQRNSSIKLKNNDKIYQSY